MKRSVLAAAAIVVGLGSMVQAATVEYNADVVSWNVGNGQVNGNFAVSDLRSTELGLRAQQRRVGPIASDSNGLYHVLPGLDEPGRAWWNFDFSADLRQNTSASALSLFVDSDPGVGTTFTIVDLTPFLVSSRLLQNSLNMLFFSPLAGPGTFNFDPNAAGLYDFKLETRDATGFLLNSVGIQVQVIPLPLASTAGMALVGMMGLRRRA